MRTQQPANFHGPAAFGLKKDTADLIHVEIQRIANAALLAADNLLADWLPDGTRKGKEYWAINPVRGDRSFSINLHTGKWYDFASGDKGADPVSLLSALGRLRTNRSDAVRLLIAVGLDAKEKEAGK